MGDDEVVTGAIEEVPGASGVAERVPTGGEQEPPAQPAATEGAEENRPEEQPGVARLRTERDEYRRGLEEERIARARAEGQLKAMEMRGTPQNERKGMTPEERRALYDSDPFRFHEMEREETVRQMQDREAAMQRRLDDERANEILLLAPEHTHPEFAKRVAAIVDEVWPNDPEDKLLPARVKMQVALKMYRKEYTDTPGRTIPDRKPAPPGGRRQTGGPGPKAPTEAEITEATERYAEAPDGSGKGWGARKLAGWRKAGLM